MNKGLGFEKHYSNNVSENEIPFLVSAKLLRSFNLGQIDFAVFGKYKNRSKIQIFELKYKNNPTQFQMKRLLRTQDYLARLFDLEVELKISLCQKTNDSLF